MLTYQLLKNNAGVMLVGDYLTLKSFHAVIHEINDNCPIIKDKEGFFLGAAYEIRKAFDGLRAEIKPPEHYPEIGPRFGAKILWPVLLLHSRMMRVYMGFMPTTSNQQAHVYAYESVIEEAIGTAFPAESRDLVDAWMRINPAHPWAENKIDSRGAIFCSWGKSERRKMLQGLLESLNPMYPVMYDIWIGNGAENLVHPSELDSWDGEEWGDPKW